MCIIIYMYLKPKYITGKLLKLDNSEISDVELLTKP